MKFLVTGNAGFIGSAIANKLIELNHTVFGIDSLISGYAYNVNKKVNFIKGDFSLDKTIAKLKDVEFDAIFHIGGQSSGEISFEDPECDLNTNALSTLKLLRFCHQTGCKKFIYASSMSVYGEQKNKVQFDEKDKTNPKSFYAVAKLASEEYMKIFSNTYGIDYVSLRYFNVYGPGQNLQNMKQGMVSIYLKQFLDSSYEIVTVKGNENRFRDLIYIDDVAKITIEAAFNKKIKNNIINVGTGKKTTVRQIIKLIKKNLKSSKKVIITDGTPGDQFGIFADNKKLLSFYNEPLISFKDGLKNMINSIVI